MNPSGTNESKRPVAADRPFPWRCRHCGKSQVQMATIRYDAEVRHDGGLYAFTVSNLAIPVCQACGDKVFTEKVDDQINAALRAHLHLLTPAEIRAALQRERARGRSSIQNVNLDDVGCTTTTHRGRFYDDRNHRDR